MLLMNEIFFIVGKNNSEYMDWQTEVLYQSFLNIYKNKKNIKFLALVMQDKNFKIPRYPFYLASPKIKKIILAGEDYAPFNKIILIRDFLKATENTNRKFIILDQDFLIREYFLPKRFSCGQHYWYLDLEQDARAQAVFSFYQKHINENVQASDYAPIGAPVFLEENILRSIIDRWFQLTYFFRNFKDKKNLLYKDWICEMYGLVYALLESKLNIKAINTTNFLQHGGAENPSLFHFCYEIVNNSSGSIIFDKKNYKPWEKIHAEESNLDKNTKDFIDYFNLLISKI